LLNGYPIQFLKSTVKYRIFGFFTNIIVIPFIIILRLIRPWLLIRFGGMISSQIGHFAANTEIYLCEKDAGVNVPKQRYIDILFFAYKPLCNRELAKMWKRVLPHVWPYWISAPIVKGNRLIPHGELHEIGNNTQNDRDVLNLLDRFPPHLQFTPEEEIRGKQGMRVMGIKHEDPFVCLTVRDRAYLRSHLPEGNWDYHNYRDTDIKNYVLACEELADRGYFVIRMGAKVHDAMMARHPRVIDYATNGMRSEFMDLYLGAKCAFCLSTGTGFDAIPLIFRRPIAYVNLVPLGYLFTFRKQFLGITKHHVSIIENRELTLKEIFDRGVGFALSADEYDSRGIRLIENSSEEIRDLVVEMDERLKGTWRSQEGDDSLQKRFWEVFPIKAVDPFRGRPLHGEIRGRFGSDYLRNNPAWLANDSK